MQAEKVEKVQEDVAALSSGAGPRWVLRKLLNPAFHSQTQDGQIPWRMDLDHFFCVNFCLDFSQ